MKGSNGRISCSACEESQCRPVSLIVHSQNRFGHPVQSAIAAYGDGDVRTRELCGKNLVRRRRRQNDPSRHADRVQLARKLLGPGRSLPCASRRVDDQEGRFHSAILACRLTTRAAHGVVTSTEPKPVSLVTLSIRPMATFDDPAETLIPVLYR